MDVTGDELAGVVDLFGGLRRTELSEALAELAYRQGEDYEPTAFESDIDEAIQSYHLVAVADDAADAALTAEADEAVEFADIADTVDSAETADTDGALLLAGPLAFPTLPPEAGDLPHILDVETRTISTDVVGEEVVDMFRDDARAAIEAGDPSRIETLLDASYELEPWAGVDLQEIREALAEANS